MNIKNVQLIELLHDLHAIIKCSDVLNISDYILYFN